MVSVIRCQTLLENLWTIRSCCLYVFYEYYYHIPSYSLGSIFINVYMVLFLFDNVIYVFLLLWLCIPIVCLCMTILTEGFTCFFLSYKANARVKPAKTGHGQYSSYFLCCSTYFWVVLCIFVLFYVLFVLCRSLYFLCVCMCTELLPPGGYPIAVKYHIIPYLSYNISYHINYIISYSIHHIISYHTILYHIIYDSVSYIISYHIVSYHKTKVGVKLTTVITHWWY